MECRTCTRSNNRRGRHRAHECAHWIDGPTISSWCGCACNQLSSKARAALSERMSQALDFAG